MNPRQNGNGKGQLSNRWQLSSRWINMAGGDVDALIALYCSQRATSPADGLLDGHDSRVATGMKGDYTAVLTFRSRCILSTRAA